MKGFLEILSELAEFNTLCECLSDSITPIEVTGAAEAQKPHLIYSMGKRNQKGVLVISHSHLSAKRIYEDLCFFAREKAVYIPPKELIFYSIEARDPKIEHERMAAISDIHNKDFAVMPVEALLQFVMPKNQLLNLKKEFRIGDRVDIEKLREDLVKMGYKFVDTVEGVGQFSFRGGIFDFYSPSCETAVRIEFFDDEVDSIREFDVLSQRSIQKIDYATIVPAKEEDVSGNILEYVPGDWYIVFDEPSKVNDRVEALNLEIEENIKNLLEKGIITEAGPYIQDYHTILKSIQNRAVVGMSNLPHSKSGFKYKKRINFQVKTLHSYSGKVELLFEDLKAWREQKYRIVILAGSKSRCENLCSALLSEGFTYEYQDEYENLSQRGVISVVHGSLTKGFEYPLINTVIVSDKEIFAKEKKTRKVKKDKNKLESYTELTEGDYVVHTFHGIGKYLGLVSMKVEGVTKDYLKIAYRDGDYLYVPVSQMDLISKYIGVDAKEIKLNKLGGTAWHKTKQKVKKEVTEMAKKLIELYAQRQSMKGIKFSPDTPWQRQFEDSFIYEETEDQLRSIEEMKRDMESERPMDRLLFGDVGFGKTEVAIRGAFKCVCDGYQVAYLVPTTILAAQHYNTFVERMKDFPIKIEMLSRFRTPTEQKRIIKGLKSGEIDIVIGTHRLIQKDVEFKKLGLLIIDEEQRFGVNHKERIKEIKKNVDCLTLSATPIPRTLHMAMLGIRDMSILSEPPQDRHPVQTYVLEYNKEVIINAIEREIARGGQVYYLYNRVKDINKVVEEIKAMLPGINVEAAHGQMSENELEDVMMRVIDGSIDVLVCTTIVETGLDIPSINTIMIEDADKLGLAQLYQLRGRVGRSSRVGYAYLTYKKDKVLDEVAEKRLRAIKDFTEFGSGFKIALRDLEIRGAGNLLGEEQHGFMNSVGYDVYCRLLEEAVRELKGEKLPPSKEETVIDLNVSAFIPDDYIKSPEARIEIYKRIASIQDLSDRYDVEEELEDRFGDPPEELRNLIEISFIRQIAAECGIVEINEQNGSVILYFNKNNMPDLEAVVKLVGDYKGEVLLSGGQRPYLSFKRKGMKDKELLEHIKIMLHLLKDYSK